MMPIIVFQFGMGPGDQFLRHPRLVGLDSLFSAHLQDFDFGIGNEEVEVLGDLDCGPIKFGSKLEEVSMSSALVAGFAGNGEIGGAEGPVF